MTRFKIEDEFEIGADAFWDMFFSKDYGQAMNDAIELKWELLEFERSGEGADERIHRVQRLTPKREVPKMMKKFVDGAISYTEHNEWRRGDGHMSVNTIPNFMADKISSGGDYRIEARGEGRCARIYDGHIECRIPLVGGKVEKMLVDEVKESYARSTAFTRQWIAKQG